MNNRSALVMFFLLLFLVVPIAILFVFTGCKGAKSVEEPNETVLYVVMSSKISSFAPGDIGDYPTSRVAGQFFECL